MQMHFSVSCKQALCKNKITLLAFFWTVGLFFGFYLAYLLRIPLSSLMRQVTVTPVSIVGLSCAACLPFLLSVLVVYISAPVALYFISFFKAVLYGFHIGGCLIGFESSGWLMHYLLTFTDTILVLLLMVFWIFHFINNSRITKLWLLVMGCMIAITCFIDITFISPYFIRYFL